MSENCKQCLFFFDCDSDEICKDFAPIEDDIEIEDIIEFGRIDFYKEWFRYIEDDDK